MLRHLRTEMNRFGQMKRSSWKPLPHSLNSDPHATGFCLPSDVKQLEQFGVAKRSPSERTH
jgi:hypothetical protein